MLFEPQEDQSFVFDERYPCTVVDIPIILKDLAGNRRRRLMPILIVLSAAGVLIPDEVIRWMSDLVTVKRLKSLHGYVGTIARLTSFYMATGSPALEDGADFDVLVCSYLLHRLCSPENVDERLFPLWEPVAETTLRNELRAIAMFVASARKAPAGSDLFAQALRPSNGVFEVKIPRRSGKGFFTHLDAQWANYQDLEGYAPALPNQVRYLARKPKASIHREKTMTDEECRAIIECTDDFSYATLFEAEFGTGGRTSEYLHMYRCDVVPSSYCHRMLGVRSDDDLLVFAHPERSTWIGQLENKRNVTRERFLRTEYGIASRVEHPEKAYSVGWKGMRFTDGRLFRVPIWRCSTSAKSVAERTEELRQIALKSGLSSEHPYLFVGTGNYETRGEPLKKGNVEEAFKRAAKKAGLYRKPGVHIHGFRHRYTQFFREDLKASEGQLMLLLGHESLHSNRAYGQDWQRAHDAVKSHEAARHAH